MLNLTNMLKAPELTAVVASTQAGSGDITPAAVHRSTSQVCSPGEGAAVVEPPTPEASPAAAGSDESLLQDFFWSRDGCGGIIGGPSSINDIVCSASSDGQVTLHRRHSVGLALTATEARSVYEFLAESANIWRKAL